MTEGINNNAYSGAAITEQNKIVRATLDTDGTVGDVKQAEAQLELSGSVFDANVAQTQSDAKIQESINANARLNGKTGALDVVKKYLGATNIFSNISFKTITGVSQELSGDAGWANQVKAELNAKVKANIQQQIRDAGQIADQFTSRISQAINQAENELCGDQDALLAKGKESKDARKKTIENLTYTDDQGNISTYDGATKGVDLSRGYEATKQYLESNGAKSFTREVDGEQKTIYKLKDGRHAIIDDAGQLHFLQTTTTIGKNTYTTFDVDSIKTQLPDGSKDVEIKRRRVDNEYRTVVRYTDSDGNKCARYVDYNEQTHEYVLSDNLTHVSAGGRAKYTTETSALSALARKEDDPVEFVNGQVKNGTYVDNQGEVRDNIMMTRRSRAKLETPEAVTQAVTNLTAQIGSKGRVDKGDNGQYTVTLNNGHSYNIDPNNPSEANRQMNFVAQELKNIGTPQTSETVALGYTWSGDTRVDANSPGEDHDGAHGHTSGVQRGVVRGNDGAFVRRSDSGHVHSLSGHLGSDKGLTAQQFRDEGWKTDANRTSEREIIAIMDKTAVESRQIPTRLLGTATQFAERFVAAYKKQNPSINIDNIDYTKLGKAIAAANPSLFDGDGNMYKNVDFQRLNLPKRLNPENYRKA